MHPGSVEYSLADTVNLVVCALHFAVNQTDPCQPTAVRRMRPDRQRELPGSVLLAYCCLPKKKTSMCSTCFVVPSGLDSCDGHILSFLSLFSLYRIQVDGWNAALLYIQFVVKPQFSVKSVWAKRLALVLYRAADETLLIGYSTLNKDVSSLISIFFMRVPLIWYLDHCFFSAAGFEAVSLHWILGFKGKVLCYSKRQPVKCSGCPLAVYRRWP